VRVTFDTLTDFEAIDPPSVVVEPEEPVVVAVVGLEVPDVPELPLELPLGLEPHAAATRATATAPAATPARRVKGRRLERLL
jgi:hypothetical protein